MARGNGSNGHNLIELHDVHKAYETSAGEITVLHDIDLRVKSNTVRFSQLEMQVVVRIIEEISQGTGRYVNRRLSDRIPPMLPGGWG